MARSPARWVTDATGRDTDYRDPDLFADPDPVPAVRELQASGRLQSVPGIPLESLAILVGIDRFMSECRALTNLVGNGVACVVISLSEGELDKKALHETMAHPIQLGEALEPG